MKHKKCDLCGADDALRGGLLCPSCREAIARLLATAEREPDERNELTNTTMETADHPETTENTREARS